MTAFDHRPRDSRGDRHRRDASAVEVCRAALDAHRADQRHAQCVQPRRPPSVRSSAPAQVDRQRASGAALGPLAGVPVALKDNLCVQRRAHDRLVADPRQLHPAVRRDGRRAARIGRRRHRRQDELRRVRDGIVQRELGVRPGAQSLGHRSHARRIERRFGGRRRRAVRAARARIRYRRIDPSAGVVLRRRRAQADLRARVALRPAGVRLVARSDRPVHTIGRAMRAARSRHLSGRDPMDSTSADEAVPDYLRRADRQRRAACASACRARSSPTAWTMRCARAFDAALDVAARRRRHARGHRAPARALRDSGLLPGLHRGGELEPRPLRRREVRPPLACREGRILTTMYSRTRDEGFGAEVKRRIMLGTYVLSAGYYDAFYLKAQQVRTLLRRDYEHAFDAGRRHRHADQPDSAVQAGREDRRPAADVSRRHLHRQREPGRAARHQHSVRLHRTTRRPNDSPSDSR